MAKYKIMAIWICMLLLLILMNTGCFEEESSSPEAFTALKKKSEADTKAKEWNDDAILIGVAGHEFKSTIVAEGKTQHADKDRGDGKCMMWMYEYHSTSADKDYFVFIEADGTISDDEEFGGDTTEITDWLIDSDAASQVAQENNGSAFLQQYPDGAVSHYLDKNEGEDPYWSIAYRDDQYQYEHYLNVKINAKTGVLISVEEG